MAVWEFSLLLSTSLSLFTWGFLPLLMLQLDSENSSFHVCSTGFWFAVTMSLPYISLYKCQPPSWWSWVNFSWTRYFVFDFTFPSFNFVCPLSNYRSYSYLYYFCLLTFILTALFTIHSPLSVSFLYSSFLVTN